MPDVNYPLLLLIVGLNVLLYIVCWNRLRTGTERFFLAVLLGGLCFYSGVGSAIVPVLWDYLFYYCCFALAAAMGFLSVLGHARKGVHRQRDAYMYIEMLSGSRLFVGLTLGAYVTSCLIPLLYPTVRLSQLWHPPAPDLVTLLNGGIPLERTVLLRLTSYVGFVVWPFYLIALFSLRRRYLSFAILTIAPVYMRYCSQGYVGRGDMLMSLGLYIGVMWLDRPAFRIRIAVAAALSMPILLVLFGIYSGVRLGASLEGGINAAEQIQGILLVETSLPRNWSELIASRRHADLGAYTKWLVTLPVPKVLTGEIAGSRINEEISAIVTGIYPGTSEYSIALTGPVVESVYIFGTSWFWLHALYIGAVGGLLCAFAGGCRSLLVVLVQFALAFGYVYNRAGIGATVPTLLNSYLSLYLTMFVFWSLSAGRANSARRP